MKRLLAIFSREAKYAPKSPSIHDYPKSSRERIAVIVSIATDWSWEWINARPLNMLSFKRMGERVNVHYKSMTVGACFYDNERKMQVYRKAVPFGELDKIFKLPKNGIKAVSTTSN